jgi:hypothetical protein
MANLTLSIDDEVLQRAREAALRDRTSVNALVRDYLIRYADNRRRRLEALDQLDALAAGTAARSDRPWHRDELHER